MNAIQCRSPRVIASAALLCLTIVAALAGIAGAERPVAVRAGNPDPPVSVSFAPKALSRTVPTPVALKIATTIDAVEGLRPLALSKVVLELDRNAAIDVKGLPSCHPMILERSSFRETCTTGIVGTGTASFDVQFPEQAVESVSGKALVFSGGEKRGVTTLYADAFLTKPISTEILMPIEIEKLRRGRYGTKATISVPLIANGAGSVTSLNLTIDRKFTYKGKRTSVATMKCTDGRILSRGETTFREGSSVPFASLRPCTPIG